MFRFVDYMTVESLTRTQTSSSRWSQLQQAALERRLAGWGAHWLRPTHFLIHDSTAHGTRALSALSALDIWLWLSHPERNHFSMLQSTTLHQADLCRAGGQNLL